MLKFIHTSDWHLGQTNRRLGPRAADFWQWRFDAARRVFELAIEKKADFILVAGDVFDSDTPSPLTMQDAVEILRDAPVPTYIISGNHDPLVEGSVWFHPAFADALASVKNLHFSRASETLQIQNGDAVLFACPVVAKHSREDSTAWIPNAERSENQARIALAHGGWKGYWQSLEYSGPGAELNSIDDQTAARCGLDYLALGDYHSFTPANHPAAKERTYYCGAPEVSARDDARAGHALLVEIEKPGAMPLVTSHVVGRAQCFNWGEIRLQTGDGLDALQARFKEIENPETTIIRAKIFGCISQSEWRDLNEWINDLREKVLGADMDVSKLLTEPTREDFLALQLQAPEKHLLGVLESPLELQNLGGVSDREIVAAWSRDEAARREARTLFYEFLRGE